MQHRDALRFARIEEANGFDIHEVHLFQIQSYRSSTLDLGLHVIKVLRSKLPAQPNPGSALASNPFDLQHPEFPDSETRTRECNSRAILKHLTIHAFVLSLILNSQEFLYGEENAD